VRRTLNPDRIGPEPCSSTTPANDFYRGGWLPAGGH